MNSPTEVLKILRHQLLIGVVSNLHGNEASLMTDAALAGGLRTVAVASDMPDCMDLIHDLHQHHHCPTVGISAVFNINSLHQAREAGASFVLFYHTNPELIHTAVAMDMLCIAGAFTPSEAIAAHQAGAHAILMFPVGSADSHTHFRLLRQALQRLPSAPVLGAMGDITEHSIPIYLDEGAELLGLTTLLSPDVTHNNLHTPISTHELTTERVMACRRAFTEHLPKDLLIVRTHTSERILDRAALSGLSAAEHVPLSVLIPGRSGIGVYLRSVLQELSLQEDTQVRAISQDDQSRVFSSSRFIRSAVVQFDPSLSHKGPFRLFLKDGDDKCDNLKHVRVIEEV